jgi:hypothetical protein
MMQGDRIDLRDDAIRKQSGCSIRLVIQPFGMVFK